jgi:hypothetical protein
MEQLCGKGERSAPQLTKTGDCAQISTSFDRIHIETFAIEQKMDVIATIEFRLGLRVDEGLILS